MMDDEIDRALAGLPERRKAASQQPEPLRQFLLDQLDEQELQLMAMKENRDQEA